MDGLIVAGGLAPPELAQRGAARIPLLRVQGETILARTCRCLIDGAGCDAVYVLAPEDVPLPELPQVRRGHYGTDLLADLTACVRGMTGDGLVVSSGDMPLLTPEAVREVAQYALAERADALYPIVDKETMEAAGLGANRTYKKVGGRTYTGGNIFYLSRVWLLAHEALLRGLFEQRKNPAALAKFFGAGFLFKVATGSLTLDYAQDYLSKRLGGTMRVQVVAHAGLAADLDKLSDVVTFAQWLDPGQISV